MVKFGGNEKEGQRFRFLASRNPKSEGVLGENRISLKPRPNSNDQPQILKL